MKLLVIIVSEPEKLCSSNVIGFASFFAPQLKAINFFYYHKNSEKLKKKTKTKKRKLKIETCIELIESSAQPPYRRLLSFFILHSHICANISVSADRLGTRSKPNGKHYVRFLSFCIYLYKKKYGLRVSSSIEWALA